MLLNKRRTSSFLQIEVEIVGTDYIKSYWNNNAKRYGSSHWASWGDNHCVNLEVELISEYLEDAITVLDVGCANGYSTFLQAEKKKLAKIVGIDFSQEMISQAELNKKSKTALPCDIEFYKGDIREIQFEDNYFDVVYTTRVLINLPTWKEQSNAIEECIRVAKPGGRIIFCEAFWEPLVLLNAMRKLVSLPALVEHDFNRYLKETVLEAFFKEKGLIYTKREFSSVYYLGSRFLRELVTDVSRYSGYENPINKEFYTLAKEYSGGGFGIQQAYIITK